MNREHLNHEQFSPLSDVFGWGLSRDAEYSPLTRIKATLRGSRYNMKIQSVELKYFKKFPHLRLDFTDSETGFARDLMVLIGMNGAGKTSLLQAIAATLGVATGRLQKLQDLDWSRFNPELLGTGDN
jgi:ABC-type transport system involved in cytochrome bd biosynthesis fused ATPase/permease subunit